MHETIGRRYIDAESAFLHIFNCFNEKKGGNMNEIHKKRT